ncbi:hypothetical protein, partial [Arthrobacter sp. TMS2-4]
QPPHTKCAATSQFNQSKNNRYQQTWHTIEFSNNRNNRHQTQPNRHVIAPEQLFKLTRTRFVSANPPIPVIPALWSVREDRTPALDVRLSADQITSSARI